jgi:hypothetical protein
MNYLTYYINVEHTKAPPKPQFGQAVGAHATPKKPIVPAEHGAIEQLVEGHHDATPPKYHGKDTGGPRRHHVLLAGHRSHPTKQHHERPGHDEHQHHELLEHEYEHPQRPLNTANKLQHPHADTESYPGGLKAAPNAEVPNVHPRSFYYDLEDLGTLS